MFFRRGGKERGMRSSMMLVALVMIMKGMQGAMEGTMRLRSLTGNTILMRCVIKSTQELRMLSLSLSHTCHMSHVPCHFDRVSGLLNFARLNVSKVIVLSIVKIAEAIVKIVRNC